MRFTPDHGWAILEGRKTTHRIPLSPRRYDTDTLEHLQFPHIEVDSYQQPIRDPHTGEPRRILGRPEKLRILSVDHQRLDRIADNPPALKAEGWTTLLDFALYWLAKHDSDPLNRMMALRAIHNQPPPDDAPEQYLSDPLDTWRARHGHKTCQVITFRVELVDTVRLLADQQGVTDAGNYTTRSDRTIDQECEAIDPELVANGPTALQAKQRYLKVQAEKEAHYADMTLGERIDYSLARARESGIDVSSVERLIHRKTVDLERRNDRAA